MATYKAEMKRAPNTPALFGEIEVKCLGMHPDEAAYGEVTINEAHDGALADALALRGYDVRLRVPSDTEVANRKRKKDRDAKRRAALEAAEGR